MESEWRDHVEHDESHLKKWGCTAMGSLTKCGQQGEKENMTHLG